VRSVSKGTLISRPVWRWDNTEPCDNSAPNENPSGLGNFTCNLRYPGQYFDKEDRAQAATMTPGGNW
jgi:hypothetical protein